MKKRGWVQKIVPANSEWGIFKIASLLVLIACIGHLVIGANPFVVLVAGVTVILSIYPITRFGLYNLGAVLMALLGFRYVGFSIFAKLVLAQPLDTNLLNPTGSFLVVFVGLCGYLLAFGAVSAIPLGRAWLQPQNNEAVAGRTSIYAAIIGGVANMAVSFRMGSDYTGITVAEFFTPFLHLALIAAIARVLLVSKSRVSIDLWVAVLLIAEVVFAIARNSRMTIMEILLCYLVTVSAYSYKFQWHRLLLIVAFILVMIFYITPIYLYVRQFREKLSWAERVRLTLEAMGQWPQVYESYRRNIEITERSGFPFLYYGKPQNVLERMSLINHVDVLKAGADRRSLVGFEDMSLAFKRVMPRVLLPEKPLGFSQGYWLYYEVGYFASLGPFPTAPLIGAGYAAFGWAGAFSYPLLGGFLWLVMVKKVCGWNLRGNIWAIYMLLRIHDQFVEGSSDAYLGYILRELPQDFFLLWIIMMAAHIPYLSTRRFYKRSSSQW